MARMATVVRRWHPAPRRDHYAAGIRRWGRHADRRRR